MSGEISEVAFCPSVVGVNTGGPSSMTGGVSEFPASATLALATLASATVSRNEPQVRQILVESSYCREHLGHFRIVSFTFDQGFAWLWFSWPVLPRPHVLDAERGGQILVLRHSHPLGHRFAIEDQEKRLVPVGVFNGSDKHAVHVEP